jgi:CubicO group peptidase (beta-lactamase class C family)
VYIRVHLRLSFCFFAALVTLPPSGIVAQSPPPEFDAYVKRVMETFTVPGLSVSIVKDGQVVLAKGYGVRRMGEPGPVDAQTRFGIASNTKLFTATALALLVEEGKIEWDKPVITYLPAFAMSDSYVTRELTVRDLLVHRSGLGLGAGDLLWWPPSTHNRKEIARRIRYIPLATSFRGAYAYDNVLYIIAGELIEAVSGQSWETFVRSRILRKVGMNDSDVRHAGAAERGNVAGTHAEVNDTVRAVAPFASDNTNPAGGIMAGAADMAKWMVVQLDSGKSRMAPACSRLPPPGSCGAKLPRPRSMIRRRTFPSYGISGPPWPATLWVSASVTIAATSSGNTPEACRAISRRWR